MSIIHMLLQHLELAQFNKAYELLLLLEEPLKVVWVGWYILYTEGLQNAEHYCLDKLMYIS